MTALRHACRWSRRSRTRPCATSTPVSSLAGGLGLTWPGDRARASRLAQARRPDRDRRLPRVAQGRRTWWPGPTCATRRCGRNVRRLGGAAVPGAGWPVFDSAGGRELHPPWIRGGAAIEAAGGTSGSAGGQWIEKAALTGRRHGQRGPGHRAGVEAIRADDEERLPALHRRRAGPAAGGLGARQVAEVKSDCSDVLGGAGDEYHALFGDLVALEAYRRSLLEQASGDDLTA